MIAEKLFDHFSLGILVVIRDHFFSLEIIAVRFSFKLKHAGLNFPLIEFDSDGKLP